MLERLDNSRIIAGGQSLVPMLNFRVANPDHLIDLRLIPGLSGIQEVGKILRIGAMTRQRIVEFSPLVRSLCPLLGEAIQHVGHQQTRNWGTVGGSLCHLDPAAELPVVALALDVTLTIANRAGTRQLPFMDFPVGHLTSQLGQAEILTQIDFPTMGTNGLWGFEEFARRPGDIAILTSAVRLDVDSNGQVLNARIAIGGIGPIPVRIIEAESALVGNRPSPPVVDLVGEICASQPTEGDDVYPAEYRQHLAKTLVKRALTKAARRRPGASHD